MPLRRLVTAAALVLAACYTESTSISCLTGNPPSGRCAGTPLTTVEITDSPFPYDSVARVDIYIVSIAVRNEPDTSNTAAGWVTVAEPRQRFNLVALSGGVTDTLGGSVVPPGQYRAVRMVIDTDSSSVTAVTGQRMSVAWQSSAGRPTLYALVENPIGVPDSGTSVVIDFDVGRSFLVSRDAGCSGRCDGFVFSPVFRAVNRFATGAVSGVVTGDTLAQYAAPIGLVTVTVFSGNPALGEGTWSVRATGRTDATGHFRIAYLPPGSYILRADAPRASPFTPGVRSNVIVTAGTEVVNQGITLPRGTNATIVVTPLPAYAYAGDSLILTASLVDSAGAVVPGATITWSNLDTAVADLWVFSSNRNRALFTAKVAGTARLFIAADGFGRTLTIPVLASPATGVSWVRVTPDSAFIAVNDSINFTASARDSAGIALPNRSYTWTSSDTTIANVRIYSLNGVTANIRGLRAGTVVIRATSGGKTGAATVHVGSSVSTGALLLTGVPAHAYVGDSLLFHASVIDTFGLVVPGTTYAWSNLDTAVALLVVSPPGSPNAYLGPRALGTAHVGLTAGPFYRDISIPVIAELTANIASVQISPDSLALTAGDSLNFIAQARDSAGVAMRHQSYAWSASDTSMARVTAWGPNGYMAWVRALRTGQVSIRATAGAVTGTSVLHVR